MPKIISGILKGRNVNGYNILGTRPTMDRVKESIFSMIQNNLHDSIVLDLFSGSGNLGIEAISNGAKFVYFNDYNRKCINLIRENLTNFNVLEKSVLLNYDYLECLNYLSKRKIKFNLVFLDPPYKDLIINRIIDILIKKELLYDKALIICEMDKKEYYNNDCIELYRERKYGNKEVFIYKYSEKNVK